MIIWIHGFVFELDFSDNNLTLLHMDNGNAIQIAIYIYKIEIAFI